MKATVILLAAALGLSLNAMAKDKSPKREKYDAYSCLHISGIVENEEEEELQDCIVELIGPNKSIDTVLLGEGVEKFDFVLKKNSNYIIRVTKKGYLKKTVAVNTQILTLENELHHFDFNISLLKETEIAKLNKNMLDYPVAMIHYDYQSDSFIHNEQYFDLVKKELYNTNEQEQVQSKQPLSTRSLSFLSPTR